MASIIKADIWQDGSGVAQKTVLGMAYGYPPFRSGTSSWFSTSATSPQSTGLYCTYTPKRSNSLLVVEVSVQLQVGSTANQGVQGWIYRDGTNLTTGLGGNANCAFFYHDSGHSRDYYGTHIGRWVTTAGNTNSTEFRFYAAAWITASSSTFGQHDGQSMISVMEIAQ